MNGPIVANSVASFKRTEKARRLAHLNQEIESARGIWRLAQENAALAEEALTACTDPKQQETLRAMCVAAHTTAAKAGDAVRARLSRLGSYERRLAAQRRTQ